MLRRYCPPTSNSALVICPSEQTRTVSHQLANTLPLSITACFSLASAAGASPAWRAWNSARRASCDCFSSSVERASSIFCGAASACGLRKVLTPMIG